MDLLDEGTLYVAKFNDDGSLEWLPLVHGQGPLTAENGFNDQADVLIWARLAGDKLGATKMDRPEDIEVNPKTGKVYLMLTNNNKRKPEQVDAANPRPENTFGHIVELTPPDGDHAADQVRLGHPGQVRRSRRSPRSVPRFSSATTANGWFGMPDNCAVDAAGRLWVATDGNKLEATGRADGVWAVETEGELRGTSRLFFRVPLGAEMCGPYFTPDDKTFFVAVQHPGEEDRDGKPGDLRARPRPAGRTSRPACRPAVGRRDHQGRRRRHRRLSRRTELSRSRGGFGRPVPFRHPSRHATAPNGSRSEGALRTMRTDCFLSTTPSRRWSPPPPAGAAGPYFERVATLPVYATLPAGHGCQDPDLGRDHHRHAGRHDADLHRQPGQADRLRRHRRSRRAEAGRLAGDGRRADLGHGRRRARLVAVNTSESKANPSGHVAVVDLAGTHGRRQVRRGWSARFGGGQPRTAGFSSSRSRTSATRN